MMNLFEKLNRLDDSLVESKRVVKKKKLTESDDQALTNKITIALIDISGSLIRRKQELKDRALKDGADRIIFFNEGVKEIARQSVSINPEINVVVYTNNDIIEDPVLVQSNFFKKHLNFKFINVSLNNSDEMLTESELTSRERLMKTFPDDFGHWSTRPANITPAHHKTMNDYARDPNTPTYDNKEVTTKPEMTARDKLLKTFPDLDIRSSKDFLKEAVKDTDYVIAYVHPVSTFSKRYSFLGSNYRMTKDLDKAMTYTSKFSAEDEIKYAKDEVERIVDSSTSTGYASNFAADSDRFLVVTAEQARELLKNPDKKVSRAVSNNSEAQKAAKPVATEIHSIIKKYNVSLSSFLMLIKELIKTEDPEA